MLEAGQRAIPPVCWEAKLSTCSLSGDCQSNLHNLSAYFPTKITSSSTSNRRPYYPRDLEISMELSFASTAEIYGILKLEGAVKADYPLQFREKKVETKTWVNWFTFELSKMQIQLCDSAAQNHPRVSHCPQSVVFSAKDPPHSKINYFPLEIALTSSAFPIPLSKAKHRASLRSPA